MAHMQQRQIWEAVASLKAKSNTLAVKDSNGKSEVSISV